MKILLKELINPNTAILNDTQKAVLIITYIAPTPEVAFSNSSASENLSTARDTLIKLGALTLRNNALELTPRGSSMLKYHNLIDDMGEITEDSQAILDDSERRGEEYNIQDVKECFKILPSLIKP